MHAAGVNEDFEKHIAIANTHCSEFFRMMKHDKQQALLLPPYGFEVQPCCAWQNCKQAVKSHFPGCCKDFNRILVSARSLSSTNMAL